MHELQVDAQRTLEAIDSALEKDKDLLDEKMINNILQARTELDQVSNSTDEKVIKIAIDRLEKVSEEFVEMRMNTAVMKAMKGHNVDELGGISQRKICHKLSYYPMKIFAQKAL